MIHSPPTGAALAPCAALSLLLLACGGPSGAPRQEPRPVDQAPGDLSPWLGVEGAEALAQYPSAPLETSDGALWSGTDGAGAVRYADGTFDVLTAADGLCSDRVCEVLRDRRGDLWFGTSSGGVSRLTGETFTTHLRTEEFSEITGWGRYMAILEDSRGDVWFGASMAGGGAHRWDGASWRAFGADDGLGTGAIPSLSEDGAGNLWLWTTAGVYRFDGERFAHFAEMPR